MAALWGQYFSCGIILLQSLFCIFLYLSHVSLLSKFESLQPDLEFRARRDIRAAESNGNNITPNNETTDVMITETPRLRSSRRRQRLPTEINVSNEPPEPPVARSLRQPHSARKKLSKRVEEERLGSLVANTAGYSGELQRLPPMAVHFVADTSNYTKERHPHYAGNGRIKVSGVYSDWRPASWTHTLGTNQHFRMKQGKVSISQEGLYLLYAQIHYANVQEVNCYRAIHNDVTLAQCCSTTAHPDRHEVKANTCTLLTTVYLNSRDNLWLTDVHERYVILTPEKSYFGLVQLYAKD